MIIDYLAFGDELEKIAASALLKRLRAGLITPEEALAASRKVVGTFGPGRVGQQNIPTEIAGKNLERLINIRTKRLMKKGFPEEEARALARSSGVGRLKAIQREGDLRTQLQLAAAKSRGATGKEQHKLRQRLSKEKQVFYGESRPEVLVGGWKHNAPTAPREMSAPVIQKRIAKARAGRGQATEPARDIAQSRRTELEEAAARLGRKRDLSGAKAHGRVLRGEARTKFVDPMIEAQRKASLEAAKSIPTPAAPAAAAASPAAPTQLPPELQAQVDDALQLTEKSRERAAEVNRRMAAQQAKLEELQRRIDPTPVPSPTSTPAAAPRPAPATTPTPAPATTSPAPSSPPPSTPPTSPSTQEGGGMSPMAIAGLGLGAAGVIGAGAYGIHRLRQRQAQQTQQGM